MGFTLTFHFVEVKVKERLEWLTVYDWYLTLIDTWHRLMHGNNTSKPAFRAYQNHEFMLATHLNHDRMIAWSQPQTPIPTNLTK